MLMRAFDILTEATNFLKRYSIEDASREAEIILIDCLGTDKTAFFRDNPEISEDLIEEINECLKRRSKREPIHYIIGSVDFLGMKTKVGKGVLIPRPETELLAEEAIKIVKHEALGVMRKTKTAEQTSNSLLITHHSSLSVLDLCTGSGCLALALAKEFPNTKVYGTDISEVAIHYAKENAEMNGIKNVTFLKGSLFEPLKKLLTFDLIVSNPPYIRKDDIRNLQPEIKEWEPVEALDGGEDGLNFYRSIIPESRHYLKESGYLMLELGISQADAVRTIAEQADFTDISFKKDYAGIERILIAK